MKLAERIRGFAEVADFMGVSDAHFALELVRLLEEAGHVVLVADAAKQPASVVLKKHFGQWMGDGK